MPAKTPARTLLTALPLAVLLGASLAGCVQDQGCPDCGAGTLVWQSPAKSTTGPSGPASWTPPASHGSLSHAPSAQSAGGSSPAEPWPAESSPTSSSTPPQGQQPPPSPTPGPTSAPPSSSAPASQDPYVAPIPTGTASVTQQVWSKEYTIHGDIEDDGDVTTLSNTGGGPPHATWPFTGLHMDYGFSDHPAHPGSGPRAFNATYALSPQDSLNVVLGGPEPIMDFDCMDPSCPRVQAYRMQIRVHTGGQPEDFVSVLHLDGDLRVLRDVGPCDPVAHPGCLASVQWDLRGHPGPIGVGLLTALANDHWRETAPLWILDRQHSPMTTYWRTSYTEGDVLPPIPALRTMPREPAGSPRPDLFAGSDQALMGAGVSPRAALDGLCGLPDGVCERDVVAQGGCVWYFQIDSVRQGETALETASGYQRQDFDMTLLAADGHAARWRWYWQASAASQPSYTRNTDYVDPNQGMPPAGVTCAQVLATPAPVVDAAEAIAHPGPAFQGQAPEAFVLMQSSAGGGIAMPLYATVFANPSGEAGTAPATFRSASDGGWISMIVPGASVASRMDAHDG